MTAPVVLAVDVGGSHVKVLLSSGGERRRFESGHGLTAQQMVDGVKGITGDWAYDSVSVGVPAPVRDDRVLSEPFNLGGGWVGFDFEHAFGAHPGPRSADHRRRCGRHRESPLADHLRVRS